MSKQRLGDAPIENAYREQMNTIAQALDDAKTELALRLGRVCDGEKGFDVACVCALMSTFAIFEGFDDSAERHDALNKVITFMREQIVDMERQQA